MQTVIQVLSNRSSSLRDLIAKDEAQLQRHNIRVGQIVKPGRPNGWTKLHHTDAAVRGALNLSWDSPTSTLTGTVVNRGKGKPDELVGAFVSYLLARFRRRIRLLQVFTT